MIQCFPCMKHEGVFTGTKVPVHEGGFTGTKVPVHEGGFTGTLVPVHEGGFPCLAHFQYVSQKIES